MTVWPDLCHAAISNGDLLLGHDEAPSVRHRGYRQSCGPTSATTFRTSPRSSSRTDGLMCVGHTESTGPRTAGSRRRSVGANAERSGWAVPLGKARVMALRARHSFRGPPPRPVKHFSVGKSCRSWRCSRLVLSLISRSVMSCERSMVRMDSSVFGSDSRPRLMARWIVACRRVRSTSRHSTEPFA